jgi:hypothetical protein
MKHLIDTFNQCSMHDASEYILKLYDDVLESKERDNRGRWINRPLFSHSSLPNTLGTDAVHVKEFDFKEPFLYCVCVHHNTNLWAKHINKIPEIILDNVRNGNGKLVFDDTMEGAPYTKFLNIIYKSIDDLNLPADKLYFVTNNLLAESTHEKWKSSNNIRKYINLFSFMYNVHDIQRLKKIPCLPDSIIMEDELKYKKDNLHNIKHFLKVNRTDRWERNLFMLHMNKNNILENSLVSFPQFQDKIIDVGAIGIFDNLTTTDNINSLRSKIPFHIDHTDITNVGVPGHEVGTFNADLPFDPIHYKNSLISLVMCAFPFQENACHLHSSTYNPMFCGHPIIQFGPYQHLKQMKKNGFKTFSKWWDESYDDEIDGYKRLKMVMDISTKISKMPIVNVFNMIVDMKNVLQHNSDLINNYNVGNSLIKKIFNEY